MSYIDEILNTTIIVSEPTDLNINFNVTILEFIGNFNNLDYFWVDTDGYLEIIKIDEYANNIITTSRIPDSEIENEFEDFKTLKLNKKQTYNLL